MAILTACKKDTSNANSTGIQGTYKFKYVTAKTNSIAINDDEKGVTTSNYTTINNGGIIVFDNLNITSTGLTYEVDTIANYYEYEGTDLVDSLTSPFTFTLPPSNSVAAYKLIGTDSIYFPQGSATSGVGGSGTIQGGPNGGRYSWNGKLLTITESFLKDSTFQDSGETIHLHESGVSSVVLEKQ